MPQLHYKGLLMNMSLLIHEMTSGTNSLDWHPQKRKLVVAHWLSVQMNKVVACLHPLLPQVSREKLSEAIYSKKCYWDSLINYSKGSSY